MEKGAESSGAYVGFEKLLLLRAGRSHKWVWEVLGPLITLLCGPGRWWLGVLWLEYLRWAGHCRCRRLELEMFAWTCADSYDLETSSIGLRRDLSDIIRAKCCPCTRTSFDDDLVLAKDLGGGAICS